ncbi:hypothetical protein KY492_26005 [Brevibacterium sp. PAMC21349]|nr:hypothetical protein KY492_26005 [Brevibacterium sp. PAMC21349]
MSIMDWLSIIAIVFSIVAFLLSWKWASDSDRNLKEIRNVAEETKKGVDERTREIERRVEERTREIERRLEESMKNNERIVEDRTKNIERIVDVKTSNIERILEDRLRDLLDRAAPRAEDKVMTDLMPQIMEQAFKDPQMMKTLIALGNQSK